MMKGKDYLKISKSNKEDKSKRKDPLSGKKPVDINFQDNRPDAVYQGKLKKITEESQVTKQALLYQQQATSSPSTIMQMKKQESYFGSQSNIGEPVQKLPEDAEFQDKSQLSEQIQKERNLFKINQLAEEIESLQKSQLTLDASLGIYGKPDKLMIAGLGKIILGITDMDSIGDLEREEDQALLNERISEGHKKLSPLVDKFAETSKNLKFINTTYKAEKEVYDSMTTDFSRSIASSRKILAVLSDISFQDSNAQRRLKVLQAEVIQFSYWLQEVKSDISGDKTGKTIIRRLSARNSKR